jgi:exopolysaccharide biosynthesis protein
VYNLQSAATFSIVADGKTFTYKIVPAEIEEPVGKSYKGWEQCLEFGELPSGIRVYKSPAQLQGKNAVAYIAVAKTSRNRTFDVALSGDVVKGGSGKEVTEMKTPNQFYSAGSYSVIINAGYFTAQGGKYYNLSLACSKGVILTPTSTDVWPGDGGYYYPTRGIFSHIQGVEYVAEWAMSTSGTTTYAYDNPVPKPTVSGALPSIDGARTYTAQTGIGGGPVLIKNGALATAEMWADEMTASDILNGSVPRTAIGYTGDNKVILFVCEGRNATPNTPGFTLTEMANILKDLGCVEALNLDGGGSSCMLVNGHETIKPSDGSQRAVTSAVVLK